MVEIIGIRSQLVDSADLPSKTGASDDPRGRRFDKVKSVRLHAFESVFDNKKTTHGRFFLVEIIGFEPMTPCLQGRCSSQLSHTPKFDALLYYQTKAMLSIKFAKFFYYIIVLLKLKTFVQQKKTRMRLFLFEWVDFV